MATFPVQIPEADCWSGDTAILGAATLFIGAPEDGIRMDLTDWSDWSAQWRPKKISKKVIDLQVEVDPSAGTIIVRAPSSATIAMGTSGYWDVQSANGSEVRTWLWGKTKWNLDVTR